MKNLAFTLTLFSAVAVLIGCSTLYKDKDYNSKAADIEITPAVGNISERIELPQAWSPQTRMDFWFTSQGSRIIPYSWFTWLEQADNEKLFRSAEHMESLRYLPMPASKQNPSGLPIGFALDTDKKKGEAWVGMSCAACHTNQMDYQGKKFLIEGAPTLGNFVLFYNELVDALNATHSDDAKFERFAKKVLGENYNPENAQQLRSELQTMAIEATERRTVNDLPDDYPVDFTSYARLDAFGNIQNAGSAFALGDFSNRNAPTAPVSYPFIWGTHQSDVVQWNASAPNTPLVGPLVRNIGEVVGVFGSLEIEQASWWQRLFGKKHRYFSSVDMMGLGHLEKWVKELRSPDWPADKGFPVIDTAKAGQGAVIYAQECAGCHQVIPRDKQGEDYIAKKVAVIKVGTDPAMAWNASYHQARTLELEGSRTKILIGDKFGKIAPAIEIPVNGVVGIVLKDPRTAYKAGKIPMNASRKENVKSIEDAIKDFAIENADIARKQSSVKSLKVDHGKNLDGLVYKARPLTSIWATAPYLHNGSVPSLWQMLQEPEDRVSTFWVGSREFDPKHVGFDSTQGLNEFKVLNKDGEIQEGNSNQGHGYGTTLSDDDKWALIEYLKTL